MVGLPQPLEPKPKMAIESVCYLDARMAKKMEEPKASERELQRVPVGVLARPTAAALAMAKDIHLLTNQY